MKYQYNFLGNIFCNWLNWHLPILTKQSKLAGNTHKTCLLCGRVIFK